MPSRAPRWSGYSGTKYSLPALLIAAVVGAIFFVLVVHEWTIRSQQQALNADTQQIFEQAEAISTNIKRAVYSAAEFPYKRCSAKDLDALQDMLWEYSYLQDIGRVQDGQVICTAGRGVLKEPWPLPPTDKSSGGARHWLRAPNVLNQGVASSMALYQDTLSFTSPFIFPQGLKEQHHIGVFVVPSNLQFVYTQFGDLPFKLTEEIQKTPHWWPKIHETLREDFCVEDSNVCVIGIKKDVGFFYLRWFYQLIAIVIGVNIGLYSYLLFFTFGARRRSLAFRLKKAVKAKQMYLEYQPKYHLASGKIVGAEALIRWQDKRLGQVPPDLFIPVAEEIGIINTVTDWVIQESLKEIESILQNNPDFQLSINLAMEDFTRPGLLEYVHQQITERGIEPGQIIFEVTERSLDGHEDAADSAVQFNQQRYQVSLDDFGTGYSNLSWLTTLNANEIKVDQSFTQAIGTSSLNQSMLEAIFALIDKLKVRAVFEGIEHRSEVDYILSHAPDAIGQGWLMSKAISAEELAKLMDENASL